MLTNTREVGSHYERFAALYLEQKGYKILAKNYRCSIGEIDLIALDYETIVFVEVKYRNTSIKGSSIEAVNPKKQRKIIKVSDYYRWTHNMMEDDPCRYDVITIDGEEVIHWEHAFEYYSK